MTIRERITAGLLRIPAIRGAMVETVKKDIGIGTPAFWKVFGMLGPENRATRPYAQVPAIYATVRSIALNISQVPFKLRRPGRDTDVTAHPLLVLFQQVNPYLGGMPQLVEAIGTALGIYGEAFVEMDEQMIAGVPVALWNRLPPSVTEKMDGDRFVGWMIGHRFVPPERMLVIKYHNPWNPLRGLSPLSPLDGSIKSDYYAWAYNQKFFEKGGMLGEVFSTDDHLTDDQFARMKNELISAREGIDRAHEGILLDGGVKVQDVRPTNRDMQFIEAHKEAIDAAVMVMKVPKPELGITTELNYATAMVQDRGFWKKTLVPVMNLIATSLNSQWITKTYGLEGYFDTGEVDALNAEIIEKLDAAKKMWEMDIPMQVINERLNLGLPEQEGWNKPPSASKPKPSPMVPIAAAPEVPEDEDEGGDNAEPVKGAVDWSRLRTLAWNAATRGVGTIIGEASAAVKEWFFKAERRILRGVNSGRSTVMAIMESLTVASLAEVLVPYIEEGYTLGWKSVKEADQTRMNPMATLAQEAGLSGIIDTVKNQIAAAFVDVDDAEDETQVVKDVMAAAKERARTIGRTEVFRAFSEGRAAAQESIRPKFKMWISSRDDRVRDSHVDMDGKIVGWNETFPNGCRFPHDPQAPPEETINCRCVIVTMDKRRGERRALEGHGFEVVDEPGEAKAEPVGEVLREGGVVTGVVVPGRAGGPPRVAKFVRDADGEVTHFKIEQVKEIDSGA